MVTIIKSRIIRKARHNTHLIVVPAHMVTDSQYPFHDRDVVIEIRDGELQIRAASKSKEQ